MILVIVPNHWGKGETIDAAYKEITKVSGSRKLSPRLVYHFDPKSTPQCYVDEMGNLCWEGVKPELIEKKGVK